MKVETAQREKLKIPIMLSGASGSGKTTSALLLAYGIVKKMFPDLEDNELWLKIGVIDTEKKRSNFLIDREFDGVKIGHFNMVNITSEDKFSVDNYEKAFRLLLEVGCEVIIIDSISHNWEGPGGMLETVESYGGRFSDWNKVKPLDDRFRNLIMNDKVFVISTARVKQDYVMELNEKGKTAPRKVGLKIIQKDNLEYELAISFRVDQGSVSYAMKDNTGIFSTPKRLTVEDGEKIFDWSETGIDVAKLEKERLAKEEEERQIMIKEIQELSNTDDIKEIIIRAESKLRNQLINFNYKNTKKLYKQIKGEF